MESMNSSDETELDFSWMLYDTIQDHSCGIFSKAM